MIYYKFSIESSSYFISRNHKSIKIIKMKYHEKGCSPLAQENDSSRSPSPVSFVDNLPEMRIQTTIPSQRARNNQWA